MGKKKMFEAFEKQVVQSTASKRSELNNTIKKLEQLPDISHSLRMYRDQTLLLTEKISSYKHDLEPFTNKLKKEFVYTNQVQVDIQRQSAMSMSMELPPPFYWDKIGQFQRQLTDLRKQLEALQSHLNDTIHNQQQTEIINTKSVKNALNASHRSTLNIAAQVITNHNIIQKLKEDYKKFRLQHYGDSHDPFHDRSERKTSSVTKIEQYVNCNGLEMNGLQCIDTNNPNNINNANNQNVNTSNNQNFGSNNNQNSNSNTSSGWNFGNNTNSNNNNNNSFNFGSNTSSNTNNNNNSNNNNNNSWSNSSYTFRSNSFA